MERASQLLLTWLLNACWQIALITALAAFAAWLLRQATARCRHLIWLAALTISFCLPVLTNPHVPANASFTIRSTIQSEPQTRVQPAAVNPIQVPSETPPPLKGTDSSLPISQTLASTLAAIYLLFLCYRVISFLRAWRLAREIVRTVSAIELPEHIRAIVERSQTALGLKRVRILCSAFVPMPITVGFLDPLVILPRRLLIETDRDLLTSAIGHELVHVLRRDYALNVMYELMYLPLSFHPAAALVRRRIRETRELSCDELVADKLLEAEVYARSLVQLAGLAMALGRHTTIPVGIADADILEERVMRMLRRPKINARSKSLLLIAASLLLALPCFAAVPFGLRINIDSQEVEAAPRLGAAQARLREEGARSEVVMAPIGANTEAGTIAAWLKKPGDKVIRGDVIAKINTNHGVVDVAASTSGVIERLVARAGEIAAPGSLLAVIRPLEESGEESIAVQQEEQAQRELITSAEAQRDKERQIRAGVVTPQDAEREARQKAEQELEKALAERARQDAKYKITTTEGTYTVTRSRRDQEEREKEVRASAIHASDDSEFVAQRRLEREAVARNQAALARQAAISMQQAIQIATSQYPGTVLQSRLVRERKQACYILSIISENGSETVTTRVLVSAVDGSVLSAVKE